MKAYIKVAATCLAIAVPGAVLAVPSEQAWQAFNQQALKQHVLPSYAKLQVSSEALSQQVSTLCVAGPESEALEAARAGFINAQQDWQSVQHIQFGPVTFLMRNFSLQYWPDKKGIGARQLRKALLDTEVTFDREYMENASVSLKGFPALESLLFRSDFLAKNAENPNYCGMANAIAANIALMSHEVNQTWQQETGLLDQGEDSSAADAATLLLKSLVEPMDLIRETKVLAIIGDSPDEVRWKKSEAAKSSQTMRNIQSNFSALQQLYNGGGDLGVKALLIAEGQEALAVSIDRDYGELIKQLESIDILNGKVGQAEYDQLIGLTKSIKALEDKLEQAMLQLDVHLGFNSRDGD